MGEKKVKVQEVRRLRALAIALVMILLAIGCAPGPREEKRVLEIANLSPLTGGTAAAEQPCLQGMLDYVRYFNEEKGIPGATVTLVWMDMGRETSRFISGYRRLLERGIPLIFSNDTISLEALKPEFEKDQIPFVTGATFGTLVYPPGWIYAVWATQGEAATAVLDYFRENWAEERAPRLQFLVVDGLWGRAAANEAANYAERIGFEVLPLEVCPYVVIDATPQLLRIREREADLVYIQHIIPGAGPIMRDAERLELQKAMQFSGTEWLLGKALMEMAPVGVEGFLAPRGLPWFDEIQIPGLKAMMDTQLKYHGKTVWEVSEYMGGWVYGAVMCEAVRRAAEEVGYENLDGVAIKEALDDMNEFDVDGMVKVSFGPEDRRGTQRYAVYQVKDGKVIRLTDWKEVPILVPWE